MIKIFVAKYNIFNYYTTRNFNFLLEVTIATENTNAPVREADGPRINQEIRAKEVRLINYNGENLGVVSVKEALRIAEEVGLDLIEISPQVNPPVCKVLDYGKYKYEQQKKQKGNNSNAKKTKEIQFTIHIEKNDLEIKLKKAKEFLEDKNNVQLVMQLKGRDMPRVDFGLELMKTICERLKPYSKQIEEPKMTGRKIIAVCRS